MPQLPSGRQVAVTFAPLIELLKAADSPFNAHTIMAIKEARDLWPFLNILFLVPEADSVRQSDEEFMEDSLPRPPGLVTVDSGFRLSDWDALTQDWQKDDKTAMREFLETRVAGMFDDGLQEVHNIQRALLASPGTMAGAFAIMWQQGCHPLQDERAQCLPDSPDWDNYDMLAALGLAVAFGAANPDAYAQHQGAFDRATGMWSMLAGHYAFLQQPIATGGRTNDLARQWREQDALAALPEERQTWLHKQLVIECVNLWNHAGEVLETQCPSAYGILTLVTFSPEGTVES